MSSETRILPLSVTCFECGEQFNTRGKRFATLGSGHLKKHDLTIEQYKTRYPDAPIYSYYYSRNQTPLTDKRKAHLGEMSESTSERWQKMIQPFKSEGYITAKQAAKRLGISHQGINRAVLRGSLVPDIHAFAEEKTYLRAFYLFTEETIDGYKPQRGVKRDS